MAGFFLISSILLWWLRMYNRARELGMGMHMSPGRSRRPSGSILVLGFIRPLA